MLRFLLDTGCLIAAQEPDDPRHETANLLVALGAGGQVLLMVATSVDYDLETASADRAAGRRQWLVERTFITRVPGPMTLDVSRLDWGDVLVSDKQAEVLRELQTILGAPLPTMGPLERWRRHEIDRHHAGAAYLAGADALVTTDEDDLLRRRTQIRSVIGLDVLSVTEAVTLIGSGTTGGTAP